MQDINKRLDQLEERLFNIELKLGLIPDRTPQPKSIPAVAAASSAATATAAAPAPASGAVQPQPTPKTAPQKTTSSATQLMAWAAGFTLLLATGHFLVLIYDSGWLTPGRQIGLATLFGVALIAAGLYLARIDRGYAAFLPAIGLVVLYLTTYAGQLYYHLFDARTAIVATGIISVAGIWLGHRFDNSVYVFFAAVGAYLTPLLVSAKQGELSDLIIYYSAWSLLFSFCSIHENRRATYMLPMFLALLGFDIAWRAADQNAWVLAASYQLVQLLIFSATAALFSVRNQRPLDEQSAALHGLALVYFYMLEYAVLKRHVPEWAPILALLSAVFVYAVYWLASRRLQEGGSAAALMVSAYCSLVATHALFFELLPDAWFCWAVLMLPALVWFGAQAQRGNRALLPVLTAAGILFGLGLGRLLLAEIWHTTEIFMPNLALLLYAVMLYGAYFQFSRKSAHAGFAPLLLYAGHLTFLLFTQRTLHSGLSVSLAWALFAVAILIFSLRSRDKFPGQSALLIFFAAGLKVLLYDLSGSHSMLKVAVLLALGGSLYAGGWLYQSLLNSVQQFHDNPAVNRQINLIKTYLDQGLSTAQIAARLNADREPCFGSSAWSAERIQRITQDFKLAQ